MKFPEKEVVQEKTVYGIMYSWRMLLPAVEPGAIVSVFMKKGPALSEVEESEFVFVGYGLIMYAEPTYVRLSMLYPSLDIFAVGASLHVYQNDKYFGITVEE